MRLLFLIVSSSVLGGLTADAIPWPGEINLPDFPKPDARRSFAELKVFGEDGSPLRLPKEDWEGARLRVAKDADWQKWLSGRKAETDAWMAARKDRPEWIAGWGHHFVSPRDGSRLTFTPDEPGEKTLSSPTDPQVLLTPKIHAAWVYLFRMRHGDAMMEAAKLYRLTGEPRYAEWAVAQLDFYAENRERWETHTDPPAKIMFQSLDEATLLIKWVETARLLGDRVGPEMKARWSEKLFLPEAALLERGFQLTHNIACWHRSASGQVALYCGDEALWKSVVDGPNGIKSLVAKGITSDYLWYEQSLGYNSYVVRALMGVFGAALRAGRGDELRHEMESVENLLLSPLSMRFPDGMLPNPADSGKQRPVPSNEELAGTAPLARGGEPMLSEAARLFPTKIGLKLRERSAVHDWDPLLDPLPVVGTAELPPVTSRNLESSRMAILKQGPWQVFFHYGQIAGTHAQSEALNFSAFYQNMDVTHDPGTPSYGATLTDGYFRTGVGHNVPLVDGMGPRGGWKPGEWDPGKLVAYAPDAVTAEQPLYRDDAKARRTLRIDDGCLVDEVEIETTDDKEHALGFVLNLQGKVLLTRNFFPDAGFANRQAGKGFSYWKDVKVAKATDNARIELEEGETRLRITFNLPGEFTIYQGTVPDYVPGTRNGIYIETRGKKATLKTEFAPAVK